MIVRAKIVGENVSYETYSHQDPGVVRGHPEFVMSRSELAAFLVNPEKWLAGGASEDTSATEWGRLVECLEMNPKEFEHLFEVHPENYPCEPTKRDPRSEKPWTTRADYCKEWEEDRKLAGITIISPKVMAEAEQAVKSAKAYTPRAELVSISKKQVMVLGEWIDKTAQLVIPLRCLIDLVPEKKHPAMGKWLADSKTARNGNPEHFARVVDDESYDIQAALSLDLYVTATGEDRCEWIFPLQENTPPYHVVKPMPALTTEFLEFGRAKYATALREYAACLTSNQWPSYSTGSRLVFGDCQYIGPENVWRYREKGGEVAARPTLTPRKPEEFFDVPIP